MPSVPISLGITGDTATAVSIAAITRSDTGVAPSGVSLPLSLTLSGGLWTGSFTDPSTLPPYYNATLSVTYSDGTTQTIPGVVIGSGSTTAGAYGDISDIRAEMGTFNEQVAADPDSQNDPTQISLHEQKGIVFADSRINRKLRNANLATPATVNLDDLKIVFGKYGAWQIYQIRGLSDAKAKNAFAEKLEEGDKMLRSLIRFSLMNQGSAGAFALDSGQTNIPPQGISPTSYAYRCRPYFWPIWW